MSDESASLSQRLRSGIEAVRSGQHDVAREHFTAVLRQDHKNVPALLWLAFVASSPRESLHLLKQVLILDPDNERARAGIRWARGRLGLPPNKAGLTEQTELAKESGDSASADDFIRKQFLVDDGQMKARKGVLAHRARRTINPFVVIIVIAGVVGLMAIGLRGLIFLPPETLAAWLPASTRTDIWPLPQDTAAVAGVTLLPMPGQSLSSEMETIFKAQSTKEAEMSGSEPPAQTMPASIDPTLLIGPQVKPAEAGTAAPVDNLLLAHRPAYPGEKWIEVNVTTQQVTAWEGDIPVMSFVVSTGLPNTPTVLGEFNIYWKLKSANMLGPNYYLPDVPYTMYFYGSYALHGTYWHHNFGQPMSHGCVNLPTEDAKKLFEWTDPVLPPGQKEVTASGDSPGTLVVVHE